MVVRHVDAVSETGGIGDDQRCEGQNKGVGQQRDNPFCHRLAVEEALAQITLQQVAKIDEVLLVERFVEAEAGHQLRLLFRRARGDVPKAVVTLIAGVCLYDAAIIAATGAIWLAVLAAAGFILTLLLQKVASGT